MAKKGGKRKVTGLVKLQIPAGKANPAPPIGPALGSKGVNIMEFCKAFNEATRGRGDIILPVVLTVYDDRSFTFILKEPPMSQLILKEAGIEKGSDVPNIKKVGKLNREQVERVAKQKKPDLNTGNLEAAMRLVLGTMRQMGVEYTA